MKSEENMKTLHIYSHLFAIKGCAKMHDNQHSDTPFY